MPNDEYAARRVHTLTVGTRAQVWNGTAKHTSGGLRRKDLKRNRKTGAIVSVRVSAASKRKFAANPDLKAHAFVRKSRK